MQYYKIAIVAVLAIFMMPAKADAYVNDRTVEAVRASNRQVKQEFPGIEGTVSHCACFAKWNNGREVVGDVLLVFKTGKVTLDVANLTTPRLWIDANFENKTCDFGKSTIYPPTIDEDNWILEKKCEYKDRTSCCCKKEETANSTKFYDCQAVIPTLETAKAMGCQATIALNDKGFCETERVVPKGNAVLPPVDTDVSLTAKSLQQRARELNQLNTTSATELIGRAIKLLMAFMGTILFALYVYAGLLWMLADGNEERISSAKSILVWSTLGVAVMFGSWVIINFIFGEIAK